MEKKLFNIKKAIAMANLVVKYHQAVNRLLALYPCNALREPLLWNLKSAYELQRSLIKNARYGEWVRYEDVKLWIETKPPVININTESIECNCLLMFDSRPVVKRWVCPAHGYKKL